jgi:hypothetical protein
MSDLNTYSPFYDQPKDIFGMALDSEGDWVHIDKARAMQDEIERLRARVAELRQHLSDAVSVANSAMIDANECADRTEKRWDREAELEAFRAALKEAKP